MFIDASAIVAVLEQEPGWEVLVRAIDAADRCYTSALSHWEAVNATARICNDDLSSTQPAVDVMIAEARISVVEIDADIGRTAIDAARRYGKGRHPARLNMGDCFSYACAKALGVPLLYKGGDIALTDMATA